MTKFTGGGRCGTIRYEVNGDPLRIPDCHCDDYRRAAAGTRMSKCERFCHVCD